MFILSILLILSKQLLGLVSAKIISYPTGFTGFSGSFLSFRMKLRKKRVKDLLPNEYLRIKLRARCRRFRYGFHGNPSAFLPEKQKRFILSFLLILFKLSWVLELGL